MSQVIGKTRLAYARPWHHVDLASASLPLGRLASRIAITLMGKHKPIYDPSTDCGDYIVATNCSELVVTGKKRAQKLYYSHSTRPGSLKSMSLERMMEKWGGGEILRRAVRGMLPKNRLRDVRLGRLKTFEGHAHPHKKNFLRYPNQNVRSIEALENLSITEIPEVKSRIGQVGKGDATV
ncbi:Topoisomerase 1-associated factor 1 [Venturia nashicola]|nr:Topoisomerase 1-associated factor 1 [Venturia nashicola]